MYKSESITPHGALSYVFRRNVVSSARWEHDTLFIKSFVVVRTLTNTQ